MASKRPGGGDRRSNKRERETRRENVSRAADGVRPWMTRYYAAVDVATDDGTGAVRDVAKRKLERVWVALDQCVDAVINGTEPSVECKNDAMNEPTVGVDGESNKTDETDEVDGGQKTGKEQRGEDESDKIGNISRDDGVKDDFADYDGAAATANIEGPKGWEGREKN